MYNQTSSSRNVSRRQGDATSYIDLGDFKQECRHCGCLFWYNERLKGNDYGGRAEYHLCCGGGKIYMPLTPDPPVFIQQLLRNSHFIEHVRAYNQMFSMTSFEAKIDDSINRRRAGEITSFKIRLYNKGGVRGYELPTSNILGGIVFEDGSNSRTDFDTGFFPDRILKPRDGTGKGKKVSMNAYYKYQLHPRVKEFGLIFRGGRLFQQYVVAVFCAIEQSRLDWVSNNQNNLRSDYILVLYTIEFQKRGLPHCHTHVWVDSSSKIRNAAQIDEYIFDEIPDPVEDPRGYKVVTELMMHGPCGVVNSSASCTENRVCNKYFPK
nr:helitron helicase-like domain-containing protein [Tanacetum cinerariifolium]